MGILKDRMVREMELRRFASGTQHLYLRSVTELAKYFNKPPDRITNEELRDYVHYLLTKRKLSWNTINRDTAAIRFFYVQTLGRQDVANAIPPRKTPHPLPEILSREEVQRVIKSTINPKHRVLLMTAYSGGLRVSEAVRLKVMNIDSERMVIRIECSKRERDRYVMLSERLLDELRAYWQENQPRPWLFTGKTPDFHLSDRTARGIFLRAKKRAGIIKKGGFHTLRHSFATHLLEDGVDIRTIQILLGHSSIQTTTRYLQVTSGRMKGIKSPLDTMHFPEK